MIVRLSGHPLVRDSLRDLFDIVLRPAAELVCSAAAIGVFRRQVRAREIELLGLSSNLL